MSFISLIHDSILKETIQTTSITGALFSRSIAFSFRFQFSQSTEEGLPRQYYWVLCCEATGDPVLCVHLLSQRGAPSLSTLRRSAPGQFSRLGSFPSQFSSAPCLVEVGVRERQTEEANKGKHTGETEKERGSASYREVPLLSKCLRLEKDVAYV